MSNAVILSICPMQLYCQFAQCGYTVNLSNAVILSICPMRLCCQFVQCGYTVNLSNAGILSICPMQLYCQFVQCSYTANLSKAVILSIVSRLSSEFGHNRNFGMLNLIYVTFTLVSRNIFGMTSFKFLFLCLSSSCVICNNKEH